MPSTKNCVSSSHAARPSSRTRSRESRPRRDRRSISLKKLRSIDAPTRPPCRRRRCRGTRSRCATWSPTCTTRSCPMKSIDQAIDDLPPAHTCRSRARRSRASPPRSSTPSGCSDSAIGRFPTSRRGSSRGRTRRPSSPAGFASTSSAEVFVIAGDAPEPAGPYDGALPFIRDFLDADPGVERVGIAGYPDGHALIDRRGRPRAAARQAGGPRRVRVSADGSRPRCASTTSTIRRGSSRERADGVDAADPARRARRGRPGAADDDGHPARHRHVDALPRARTVRP